MSQVSDRIRPVGAAGLVCLVFLALIPAVASAGTIEVAEGTGTDVAGCGVGSSPPCRTIQYAVNAAGASDTVHVGPGRYEEQVDVTKPLTIRGSGPSATRIVAPPEASLVTHGAGGEHPIVTGRVLGPLHLADLQIDGAHHGSASGAKCMDGVHFYRVSGTVDNVHLTGVRAPTVSANDCGSPIYGFLNTAGTVDWQISNTRIDDSAPIGTYLTSSGAGVATASVSNSTILGPPSPNPSSIPPAGLTIAGVKVNVEGNTFRDFACSFGGSCGSNPFTQSSGLALSMSRAPGGTTVTNNVFINNDGGVLETGSSGQAVAVTANRFEDARSYGLLAASADVTVRANRFDTNRTGIFLAGVSPPNPSAPNATILGNTMTGNDRGIYIAHQAATAPAPTGSASANRIAGNGVGLENTVATTFNAENNWWGCNAGPGQPGCDTATGQADADPWLTLGLTADPASIPVGGTSSLTASLAGNSNSEVVGDAFPDGTMISFATDLGSVDAQVPTAAGRAVSTLTSPAPGVAQASATLDNQSVTVPVTVSPTSPPPETPCSNAIKGDGKAEKLTGTDTGDVIKGKAGNDKINGLGGEDCISGGPGDDKIKVRDGEVDRVNCGPGEDRVKADKRDEVKKNCEKVKAKP